MKIGIYDPYLDDVGGGEKYMMTLATSLAKYHDVTVFWDTREAITSLTSRFGFSFTNIIISKNIFSPNVSFFKRAKESKKFDALILLSDGSVPLVFPRKLFLHIQQPLPATKSPNLKEKLKQKRITALFYNSQFTKRANDHLFPGVPSRVIYPPVTLVKSFSEKENHIVHVGRFRVTKSGGGDYKKQGFLLSTFKKMCDEGLKNWTFDLASSVNKEDEETFAILQKSVQNYPVTFHINKANHELFALYERAKIYWHASGFGEDLIKHPALAEHFGMTTVEAMGAGVVPVVINSGGQKEIVTDGENGLLWNTESELRQKTNSVITDSLLLHKLSKNATIRAQDFSVEKFCEAIDQLITL